MSNPEPGRAGQVLRPEGVLGSAQVRGLHARWAADAGRLVAIDLAAVTDIDSAGVAWIGWMLQRSAQSASRSPSLLNPPQRYHDICRAHRVAATES